MKLLSPQNSLQHQASLLFETSLHKTVFCSLNLHGKYRQGNKKKKKKDEEEGKREKDGGKAGWKNPQAPGSICVHIIMGEIRGRLYFHQNNT